MLHVKTHDEDHVKKLRCRYVFGGNTAEIKKIT